MLDLLRETGPFPKGFLLHSYGGSREMVSDFVDLGAYFSFPGYYARERKTRQREVFCEIPMDRLLVETDAPDQLPPDSLQEHELAAPDGAALNHPANLPAIYRYLAALRELELPALSDAVQKNFERLFGSVSAR